MSGSVADEKFLDSFSLENHDKFYEEVDRYLLLLRDLTWKILKEAADPISLKKRFGSLIQEGYPPSFQLPYAYTVLISFLLEIPTAKIKPCVLPNGCTFLNTGQIYSTLQVPELTYNAELGALWIILGKKLHDDALLYAGLKLATWQLHTLDHQGKPHLSLWTRALKCNPLELAIYNELIFLAAYKITGKTIFYQAGQLQKLTQHDPSSLSHCLLGLLEDSSLKSPQFSSQKVIEEMTVGCIKFTTAQSSIACSLSGFNSGMFSFHKNTVSILNAAPQLFPLDNLETFGISRRCSLKERMFQDILWEKSSYHFRLKGWTKLFAAPLWVETDFYFQAQKLIFTFRFEENKSKKNLYMIFYCRAEKILIGGKTILRSGELKKYEGKPSSIELIGYQEELLYLDPPLLGSEFSMQIIPLAGGTHFWGSDFIVAFPIEEDKNYFQYQIK